MKKEERRYPDLSKDERFEAVDLDGHGREVPEGQLIISISIFPVVLSSGSFTVLKRVSQ
jgi:hypothetical protein